MNPIDYSAYLTPASSILTKANEGFALGTAYKDKRLAEEKAMRDEQAALQKQQALSEAMQRLAKDPNDPSGRLALLNLGSPTQQQYGGSVLDSLSKQQRINKMGQVLPALNALENGRPDAAYRIVEDLYHTLMNSGDKDGAMSSYKMMTLIKENPEAALNIMKSGLMAFPEYHEMNENQASVFQKTSLGNLYNDQGNAAQAAINQKNRELDLTAQNYANIAANNEELRAIGWRQLELKNQDAKNKAKQPLQLPVEVIKSITKLTDDSSSAMSQASQARRVVDMLKMPEVQAGWKEGKIPNYIFETWKEAFGNEDITSIAKKTVDQLLTPEAMRYLPEGSTTEYEGKRAALTQPGAMANRETLIEYIQSIADLQQKAAAVLQARANFMQAANQYGGGNAFAVRDMVVPIPHADGTFTKVFVPKNMDIKSFIEQNFGEKDKKKLDDQDPLKGVLKRLDSQ